MIYCLWLLLVLLLFVCYRINQDDVLCPSFIFCLSFLFSVTWACLYKNQWNLELHLNTFLVIGGGIFEFMLVCCLVKKYYEKNVRFIGIKQNQHYLHKDMLKWAPIICVCFFAAVIFWTIKELTGWAGLPFRSFVQAGRMYDNLKFSTYKTYSLPSRLQTLRVIADALGFFFSYSMANEFMTEKRISILKLSIFILDIFNSILLGSRTEAVYKIITFVFFLLFIKQKNIQRNKILSFKSLLIIVGLAGVMLASFRSIALLMGRTTGSGFMDYLALYIGAEIKNLDTFLQEPHRLNSIWNNQTFIYLVQPVGRKLGIPNMDYTLDLPFRYINGYSLGNVYTIFYPFYYDFGWIGIMVITALTAAISQTVYEAAKNSKHSSISLLCSLIYGSVFCSLLFAFFSNKFYENIVTIGFLKKIVFWLVFEILFYRISGIVNKENELLYEAKR